MIVVISITLIGAGLCMAIGFWPVMLIAGGLAVLY